MDLLRARAYLDILLGIDSRPLGTRTGNDPARTACQARRQPGQDGGPGGPSDVRTRRRRVWSGGRPRSPGARLGRWPG